MMKSTDTLDVNYFYFENLKDFEITMRGIAMLPNDGRLLVFCKEMLCHFLYNFAYTIFSTLTQHFGSLLVIMPK